MRVLRVSRGYARRLTVNAAIGLLLRNSGPTRRMSVFVLPDIVIVSCGALYHSAGWGVGKRVINKRP